jgi:2,5-diketo-D-gluconate reductase B
MSGDSAKQSVPSVHANGADIPCVGFGTYGISSADMLRLIPAALKTGFRHIDTAQIYGNEAEVGEGILRSGVPREDVFITTKVWVSNLPRRRFLASVDESLRNLRTDFIDLLLLHWPSNLVPLADQIGVLNEVVHDGKVLNIGVSNFNRALVEQAVELSDIPLATNQFEYHPYLNQSTLLAATRRGGMSPTAYCVMAVGKVFTDPRLTSIAARYRKSVSQIVLRWIIQQGVVALSRTVHEERLAENINVFNFELGADDMAAIHKLAVPNSRIVDPPGLAPVWDATT